MRYLFRRALGVWVLSLLGLSVALAATFPDRSVTMVVPYPAGGATDVIARLVAEKLAIEWGQQVIVNNRPGAGTTLAAEAFSRTPGDGYTLFMTTAAHTISASLYKNLAYDPVKDFAPITLVATIPLVLVTTATLPANNLSELIELGKRQNGLTMGSTGNGTPQHLAGELFKAKTGMPIVHVPYKGDAPMITDLVGGQVQMAFVTLSAAVPYIKSGKLKAIALAHPTRVDAIVEVPTMTEAGVPGFAAATWFGLFGPASMPIALREKIYRDCVKIVSQPELQARLIEMGAQINNSNPHDFELIIAAEVKNWSEAVRLSGAQLD